MKLRETDSHAALILEILQLQESNRELAESMRGLFDNCAMVHKYWGENSNTREADAAEKRARAALARVHD